MRTENLDIKILLYEDNADLRNSLSSLISFSDGFKLVGSFENAGSVLNHIEQFEPDVVLMDIDMPLVDGIAGLKAIRKRYRSLPVIMLTVFDDDGHVIDAIKNGATGYILKQHLTTRLAAAIQEVVEGGAPMSPVVARMVLNHFSGQHAKNKDYRLTNREKQILQSLTEGNSYKLIALNEGITMGTVTTHIKNIYEKLGVHSQAEAVSKALKEGLL
ncbi:MAG: response regulator transcription factor [Chitinophagaceae bacterium]|nr:response regulator transcription factor [Chitinophagaceae bacterium]